MLLCLACAGGGVRPHLGCFHKQIHSFSKLCFDSCSNSRMSLTKKLLRKVKIHSVRVVQHKRFAHKWSDSFEENSKNLDCVGENQNSSNLDCTSSHKTSCETIATSPFFAILFPMDPQQGNTTGNAEVTVTPWEVKGKVDYAKLIEKFGSSPIDEALIQRFEKLTGKPAHPWLKRGVFFSHRFY